MFMPDWEVRKKILEKGNTFVEWEINMRKIIKNAIQCKICGDIIESTYRHEYVQCKCGACAVDGGHDYLRRSFKDENCYIDLSETINIVPEEKE